MTGEMEAVLVKETSAKGDWNLLKIGKMPIPSIRPEEVLVQVEACSVNRADLLQRRGLYPPPSGVSPVLGLDFAGTVAEVGPKASGWKKGDRVFGIVAGGGYARYVAVHKDHLLAIPENLSFVEAAAAAEVFFTAHLNLFEEARLQAGETLFLHGGGSGVGTAAIQLARQAGAAVIITAGGPERIQRCLELGASFGINYKEEDFASRVMEFTRGQGVDVILDWIGAPYLQKHIRILRSGGRLVLIGLMGGNTGDIHLAPLLTKRLRIIGSVLRTRSVSEKAALTASFKEKVLPLLASGAVRPVIHAVYPFEAVEEAHLVMKSGAHFGKIVLSWQK